MPSKEPRPESPGPSPDTVTSLKRVERFLRLLTWQMFFLLAILLYLAVRPQAGRFQFTVAGEDVVVFDTASSRALAGWHTPRFRESTTARTPRGEQFPIRPRLRKY